MMDFLDLLVVAGMFVLRFGAPLAITVGLVYLLKRLDRRWAAEAWAQAEAQPATRPEAPARPQRTPATDHPFMPQPMAAKGQDIAGPQMPTVQPCWEMNGCPEAARSKCPAHLHPEQPCWQARLEAGGELPAGCPDCAKHRPSLAAASLPQSSARNGGVSS